MPSYKVSKEIEEQRAKEGGLLIIIRKKLKIHWERLKFEGDPDKVADYLNNVIQEYLKGKEDNSKELEMEKKTKEIDNEMKNENEKEKNI